MIYKRVSRSMPYTNIFKHEPLKYWYSSIDLSRTEKQLEKMNTKQIDDATRIIQTRYFMQHRYAIIKYRLRNAYH